MRTRASAATADPPESMAARLRRRAPPRASKTTSSTSNTTQSHGRTTRRATRHAQRSLNTGEEDEEGDDDSSLRSSHESRNGGDDGTEDESDGTGRDDSFPPPKRSTKRTRTQSHYSSFGSPQKRQRPRRSFIEFSDESHSEDAYLPPSPEGTTGRRRKMNTQPKRNDLKRKKRSSESMRTRSKKAVVATIDDDAKDTPTPGLATRKPPWNTLPYLVLTRIFTFAACPLDNISSVRWLVTASLTCRAFAEPALRALYECPPLLTMNMAHALVDLLDQSPSTTVFDYRKKVKSLRIDVGSLASRVYKGRYLDISGMAAHCSRLAELDLYHYKDMPPYRELSDSIRWAYPRGLFEALGALASDRQEGVANPVIRLKSWRWNQRMMGRDVTFDDVRTLHLSPTFAGLCKIIFTNYQRPSLKSKHADDPQAVAEDVQQAEVLAGLLDILPSLTHLVMESSTAANELLLPLLPKTLQHLELINCWDVTAAHFSEYLVTHGQQLRHLALHHNQSLSLTFLPVLGVSCPNLLSLEMNLSYFKHHSFYRDSDPLYDSLLLDSQIPTWPPTIQRIELENLRKWEPSAAAMFLQSLVDSAPHIPMLRVLTIKAMLDIPWRHRCQMRDQWEAELDRVFKRHTSMPEPADTLQYYQNKEASMQSPRSKTRNRKREEGQTPQRRSHRIATHMSNSSSRASSATRDLRAPQRGRISYREPDSDEDIEFSDENEEEEEGERENTGTGKGSALQSHGQSSHSQNGPAPPESSGAFIHGLCDVVDMRIDNQKPGEIQYRMVDFLDSDDSNSDDEWTGDSVEVAEYAW